MREWFKRQLTRIHPANSPTSGASRMDTFHHPGSLPPSPARIISNLPIRHLARGRITEADIGYAATTPILGQYASIFGWPDDWGFLWEYLDAYLFVPEVKFAIELKNRLIWRNGFSIHAKTNTKTDQLLRQLKAVKFYPRFKGLSWNALVLGNGYVETVDDSEAIWTRDRQTVQAYQPATQLYGFKPLDARTMRVQIDPQRFDTFTGEPDVVRFIQRRWAGPFGSTTPAIMSGGQLEIDFHRDQIIWLRFNKVIDGIYGYSMLRSVFFALKGWLLMQQFVPAIVQKRADPLLHFLFGGKSLDPQGREYVKLPTEAEFQNQKERLMSRAPNEDLFTDIFTEAREVYKSQGPIMGLVALMQQYKERVLMGLNVPAALSELIRTGEVKWGNIKWEVLEDEIKEYQHDLAELVNDRVLPRLTNSEVEFEFNPITEEDTDAVAKRTVEVYSKGIANAVWARQQLNIPEEYAEGAQVITASGPVPVIPSPAETPLPQEKFTPFIYNGRVRIRETPPGHGPNAIPEYGREKLLQRTEAALRIPKHDTIIEFYAGEGTLAELYAQFNPKRHILVDDDCDSLAVAKKRVPDTETYCMDADAAMDKIPPSLEGTVTLADFDPYGSPAAPLQHFFAVEGDYKKPRRQVVSITDGYCGDLRHMDPAKVKVMYLLDNEPKSRESMWADQLPGWIQNLITKLSAKHGFTAEKINGAWKVAGSRVYYCSYLITYGGE